MRSLRTLSLSRETLWRMDARKSPGIVLDVGNDSCVLSCLDMSCEGGCTISTGLKG
jgi:hypothetical protein